jgi:hypothetical protein
MLLDLRRDCPGLAADLLTPPPAPWMGEDVFLYQALHRARLAQARAIHLHIDQVSAAAVATIRARGIDVHVWGVEDARTVAKAVDLRIPKVCTDHTAAVVRLRRESLVDVSSAAPCPDSRLDARP